MKRCDRCRKEVYPTASGVEYGHEPPCLFLYLVELCDANRGQGGDIFERMKLVGMKYQRANGRIKEEDIWNEIDGG